MTKTLKEEQSAFNSEVLPKYFLNNKYAYIFFFQFITDLFN